MIKIAPSTNPCPENKLIDYIQELQNIGVEILHCDVMDGQFVENQCLPIELLEKITKNTLMFTDVHLMVANIAENIEKYLNLNVNSITVHYESFKNTTEMMDTILKIKQTGKACGISIKPETAVRNLAPILPLLDLVLIMSVEPGKSGQEFISFSTDKVLELRQLIDQNMLNVKIEVDGGINKDIARQLIEIGADYLVMGSAFYNAENKKDLLLTIQSM